MMLRNVVLLCGLVSFVLSSSCSQPPSTVGMMSANDAYCDQPMFTNLVLNTEEFRLLDNICNTFFPLPDDPSTLMFYQSRVYCDGSNQIISAIITEVSPGTLRVGSPFATITNYVFGYAGCDTYLSYRCSEFGAKFDPFVIGLSSSCKPLGLSCLRKVEELVKEAGLPDQDFYVLPMKLPNRCVTQQLCLIPPNPFYNQLL